jgi:multimeric flavodoxin WrbA
MTDWRELAIAPAAERCLFALGIDELGPVPESTELLRLIRSDSSRFSSSVAGLAVEGTGELDTKALARRLVFQLSLAGCSFPERPLAEGTGSLHNWTVLQRRLGLDSREAAWAAALEGLCRRVLDFTTQRYERPRVLMLHASDHATSNTLALGERISDQLGEAFSVRIMSLRNGTIEDCRGCSYKVCTHFASKGACFYGGSIATEVIPAVLASDILLLLLPNYNDAVGANIMAFINRMTSLHVSGALSGKTLFAVVVSGYSGGDLVAEQAMGALCLNKSFLLPPRFCLLETANDPGEVLRLPGVAERVSAFAARIRQCAKKSLN